jgi:uncharacterized protein YkwD
MPVAAQAPAALERSILTETNLARTDPESYARHLEQMLAWFEGDILTRPGSRVGLRTKEGARAVREAIAFLRRQEPRPPLTWSDGLWRAARDHARDQGSSGATGHTGGDGSTIDDRTKRYGRWLETVGENIEYGSVEARDVVIALIVDDGVPDRGHRTNIFASTFRVMGAACGPHATYRRICVIDYAGGFEANRR